MIHRSRVSTSYARILHEYLALKGFNAEAVLGQKAPQEDPTGQSFTLLTDLLGMFEQANSVVNEPAMGLQVGALIQPAHVGLVGYLLLNCRTLAQAMYRFNEFERLYWDSIPGKLRPELHGVRITWDPLGVDNCRLIDECNLAAIVTFARNIASRADRHPVDVHFTFPRPADLRPYETFFQCPVHFDARATSVAISYQDLLLPVRGPDESLFHLLELQARARIAQRPEGDPLSTELSGTIAALLTHGDASLVVVAQRMGCSVRTLQRRLDASGTTFQAVLDSTRQALSEAYLRDPGLRLAELAQLLGYADQAAFTRAFKRWKGVSPARWRRELLASS